MKTAVIIIGHDSDANLSLASRALSDVFGRVEVASLDDLAGSIEEAVDRCADEANRIIVLPYTLELSDSELRSLEAAVGRVQKTRPDLDIRLSSHVGFVPRLIDILEECVTAAANESSANGNVPIITVESQGRKPRGFTLSDLLALPDRLDDIGWLDKRPLPAVHGGPIRLFIPGIDDRCANVKSVDRLIVE